MNEKDSIIDSIYYADLIPGDKTENDMAYKLEKKFFEKSHISPNSKLAAEISNYSADYAAECRSFGFAEGFKFGARLMMEVLRNE